MAALRLITSRRFAANTPVAACGYTNRASAEPSAKVPKAHSPAGITTMLPYALPVAGLTVCRCAEATLKTCAQPPSRPGM